MVTVEILELSDISFREELLLLYHIYDFVREWSIEQMGSLTLDLGVTNVVRHAKDFAFLL